MLVDGAIREVQERGYCVLPSIIPPRLVEECGAAFAPVLQAYLETPGRLPNRGPDRHFIPMPFHPPCFAPEFFFDPHVLSLVRGVMGDRIVADHWGCDVPLQGSGYQEMHADFRRPLFEEAPDLPLPAYILVVSFGLVRIAPENGPIEIAPGTHRLARGAALEAVNAGAIGLQTVPLEIGDVLIRDPRALHRGTPNTSAVPRPLVSLRYVRRWYTDDSREVNPLSRAVWQSLSPARQSMMRFPVEA